MKLLHSMCIALAALVSGSVARVPAAETTPDAKTATVTEQVFNEPGAGFSMQIPAGYTRLSDDENREVFSRLSEHFGKEAGERALRQPPVRFKGPVDPKRTEMVPPSLTVTCSGLNWIFDAAKKAEYKDKIEQDYKKSGVKHGDISLDVITVGGVNSLRADHDIYSPVDNTRGKIAMVIVPGAERSYDIVFSYSEDQAHDVDAALATVIKSFKAEVLPVITEESMSSWKRVLMWTLGCFVAGIVLSLLLKTLAGVGEKSA